MKRLTQSLAMAFLAFVGGLAVGRAELVTRQPDSIFDADGLIVDNSGSEAVATNDIFRAGIKRDPTMDVRKSILTPGPSLIRSPVQAGGSAQEAVRASLQAADVYAKQQNWSQALAEIQRGLELDPDNFSLVRKAAAFAALARKFGVADEYFQRVLNADPDSVFFLTGRAGILLRLGRLKESDELVKKALAINPAFLLARFNGLCVQIARGDTNIPVGDWDLLTVDDIVKLATWLNVDKQDYLQALGPEGYKKLCDIVLGPGASAHVTEIIGLLKNAGMASRAGRWADSQGLLSKVKNAGVRAVGIDVDIGRCLYEKGDKSAAAAHFKALADRYPKAGSVLYDYAYVLINMDLYNQAGEILERVCELNPKDGQAAFALACSYAARGQITAGDLIEIKMTWSDGPMAERIVGSWAGNYERYVNAIYGSGYSPTASLGKETASAKEAYERAQANYGRFVGDNRIQDLNRQVDERKRSIAILQQRVDSDRDGLFALYTTRLRLQQTLEDARTLRDQVARPGSSAGSNALAITLLKAQLVVSSTSLGPSRQQAQLLQQAQQSEQQAIKQQSAQQPPIGLTIQATIPPTSETAAVQLADLEALVRTAEERLTQVDAAITQRSAEIQRPNPSQTGIDRLQKEQLGFEQALATEQATLKELTRARDLAWSTYSSLASKVDERNVAQQVGGTEVVYAIPARSELTTTLTKRLVPVVIAVAAALIVALMAVGLLETVAPEAPTPHIRWTAWLRRRRPEA